MRKLFIKIAVVCVVLALLISLSIFASPKTAFNRQSSFWNPSPPPDAVEGRLSQWNPAPPPDAPVPRLAQWNPAPPPDAPVPR